MVFSVVYPTGNISIIVENYVAKATIPTAKQLFKLAKQCCTESDKQQLITDLQTSKTYWSDWLDQFQRGKVLAKYMWVPTTTTQIYNLHKKIDKLIEYLKKDTWLKA